MRNDFAARQENWGTAWMHVPWNARSIWFGQGTGSYPASQRTPLSPSHSPTDFSVYRSPSESFLQIRPSVTLYFGQKLLKPAKGPLEVRVRWRSEQSDARLTASLCDKILLYSENCGSVSFTNSVPPGEWNESAGIIEKTTYPMRSGGKDWLPPDFSFWVSSGSSTVEIDQVALVTSEDENLLENSEFSAGMNRWYLSDDYHWCWRIENEFVSSWFEGGIIRVVAITLLLGTSAVMAFLRIRDRTRSSIVALSFLAVITASFLFDTPLQSPGLSTMMYLIAFSQLIRPSQP